MSQEKPQNSGTKNWILLGLVFIFIHYFAYLWPFVFDSSIIARMEDRSDFEAIRSYHIFLVTISIITILFALIQIKFWRTATLLICLFGILNGETLAVFHVWFSGVNSFEALASRWDLFSQYPRLVANGLRGGVFIPLLYLAIIVLTIKDWKGY